MSKLETTISELERQLSVKRAFQAVKFVFPKSTPDDVEAEIQAKLREIADALALGQDAPTVNYEKLELQLLASLTKEQIEALKLLADSVIAKTNGSAPPASPVPTSAPQSKPQGPTPGGASTHQTAAHGRPRKGKVLTAENVRGEGRKFVVPEDEVYVPNPEKVDDHGMVSATHMKRGISMKIPVDDLEFLD